MMDRILVTMFVLFCYGVPVLSVMVMFGMAAWVVFVSLRQDGH